MQLFGDRIVAPRELMIREIIANEGCLTVTLDQALFVRQGETLWLDKSELVVERLDGTTVRPGSASAMVRRSFRLL
ncbi:hypothetical protein Cs7R123_79810 [Catellatospora sp. TT07R-123]|uniref:hypothetical protein n=1 Tax=Catellatospora sp. TT07R-123 TaxID=2733863 RepID=UPI001B27E85B|nr:hypothetical protein [Catellatospora sp. TT07R-123]GHJ50639.1 hypothetical protein Cs7R123_79810 [Catellatospora sp. TT07R-123]